MTGFGPEDRLARVDLVETEPALRSPELQQELDVALYDLAEDNRFRPADAGTSEEADGAAGPFELSLGLGEGGLAVSVRTAAGQTIAAVRLPLSPFRALVEDYVAVCERYHDAVRRLPRTSIEAIDAERRAIHDDGAALLLRRIGDVAQTDHETARRLFTVVAAMMPRG